MKKQLLLLTLAAFLSVGQLLAQGGGQRQTPEERTTSAMEKIAVLNLSEEATSKTRVIISEFYQSQQKAMQELRASGNMDREAMMAKRKELSDNRDKQLKAVFTEEQLKKWTEEIEPSLRPQRGGGQRQ